MGTAIPTASRNHARRERILDQMRSGISRRQRDGDDETGCREAEQAEDERFAAPARQQLLEYRDAALPAWAELRDAAIHRQSAKQREQDEDKCGERGEHACRQERNAWLVTERREVVDAGQAHDLPPGMLVYSLRKGVWPLRLASPLEEPHLEPATLPVRQSKGHTPFRFHPVRRPSRARDRMLRRTRLPTSRQRPWPGNCRSRSSSCEPCPSIHRRRGSA
jgi:hypothetical protein